MRNKFSEILNLPFESYQSFGSEIPTVDPICKTYNNIFGLALNTHMSIIDDKRVITGHYINTPEWDKFICSSTWGGLDFRHAGYESLCYYLNSMSLTGRKGTLNGDVVYWVEDQNQIPTPENLVATNESKENEFYNILKKHLNDALDEALEKKCSPTTITDFEKVIKQYIKEEF